MVRFYPHVETARNPPAKSAPAIRLAPPSIPLPPQLAPRGDVFAAQISLVSEGETDEARVLGTVHSAPEPLSGAECNAANGPAAGIVASTLPHRDIESAVAFLLAKRVFADDPAMQATQFNYLRNPRSAPPGRVHEYEKHQRVALKLMSLLVHGEHGTCESVGMLPRRAWL